MIEATSEVVPFMEQRETAVTLLPSDLLMYEEELLDEGTAPSSHSLIIEEVQASETDGVDVAAAGPAADNDNGDDYDDGDNLQNDFLVGDDGDERMNGDDDIIHYDHDGYDDNYDEGEAQDDDPTPEDIDSKETSIVQQESNADSTLHPDNFPTDDVPPPTNEHSEHETNTAPPSPQPSNSASEPPSSKPAKSSPSPRRRTTPRQIPQKPYQKLPIPPLKPPQAPPKPKEPVRRLSVVAVAEAYRIAHMPQKIPRPPNAYLLYRKDVQPKLLAESRESNESKSSKDFSMIVGKMWREESAEVKQRYEELAFQAREQHKIQYPDWKYSKKANKKYSEDNRPKLIKDALTAKEASAKNEAKRAKETAAVAVAEDIPHSPAQFMFNLSPIPTDPWSLQPAAQVNDTAQANGQQSQESDPHSKPSTPSSARKKSKKKKEKKVGESKKKTEKLKKNTARQQSTERQDITEQQSTAGQNGLDEPWVDHSFPGSEAHSESDTEPDHSASEDEKEYTGRSNNTTLDNQGTSEPMSKRLRSQKPSAAATPEPERRTLKNKAPPAEPGTVMEYSHRYKRRRKDSWVYATEDDAGNPLESSETQLQQQQQQQQQDDPQNQQDPSQPQSLQQQQQQLQPDYSVPSANTYQTYTSLRRQDRLPFRDQLAVITFCGADPSIGVACAQAYRSLGARVLVVVSADENLADVREWVLAVQGPPVTETSSGETVTILEGNVTKIGEVEKTLELIKASTEMQIDHLINCIGFPSKVPVKGAKAAPNPLFGATHLCRSIASHMAQRGTGCIVNVSSTAEIMDTVVTAKAGVIGFSMSLAQELKATGVRVSAVVPGVSREQHESLHSEAPGWEVADVCTHLSECRFLTEQVVILEGMFMS